MDVKELNEDQLNQLKLELFYMSTEDLNTRFCGTITKEMLDEINNASFWENINDKIVYDLYEGISFVEEDFTSVREEK